MGVQKTVPNVFKLLNYVFEVGQLKCLKCQKCSLEKTSRWDIDARMGVERVDPNVVGQAMPGKYVMGIMTQMNG